MCQAPGLADALLIRLDRITMIRATGWTRAGPSLQMWSTSAFACRACRRVSVPPGLDRPQSPASARACMDPPAASRDWSLPLAPMIGCFGVAPALGQAISTATSAEYGGNMDYRRFGAGSSVRFPVSAPGGLFFFGDCHAVQGDGEIVGTGIETAARSN